MTTQKDTESEAGPTCSRQHLGPRAQILVLVDIEKQELPTSIDAPTSPRRGKDESQPRTLVLKMGSGD